MNTFVKKHARRFRNLALVLMMVIPFLLYWAAVRDMTGLVYVLLSVMGFSMLITIKIG